LTRPWELSVAWLSAGLFSACNVPVERFHRGDAASGAPADVLPQFTSCMGLAMTCGASSNCNCCQTVTVPGGTFYRSYDGIGYNETSYRATVSTFVLDKYEVTVGRFRAFVNAGLGTQGSPPVTATGAHPKQAGSGWDGAWNGKLAAHTAGLTAAIKCSSMYQTWTDTPGANENQPMNCVTWYEAMAFCIWDGGYLPTEAEWNYAASGGGEQRAHPWSSPPSSTIADCTYANYKGGSPSGMYCVNGAIGGTDEVGRVSPKGDGRWGHSDLSGNVWEWALDWYASPYTTMDCNDCANLMSSPYRVFRGGSFEDTASLLRVAFRGFPTPTDRYPNVGLRCARTPVPSSSEAQAITASERL
jgi:formylglycine-generating enzyme